LSRAVGRTSRADAARIGAFEAQPLGFIACGAKYFLRKRNENFANETVLLRLAPDKLLKSLDAKACDFAVFNDFNGLRANRFRISARLGRFDRSRGSTLLLPSFVAG
jgi:hypothetical protein